MKTSRNTDFARNTQQPELTVCRRWLSESGLPRAKSLLLLDSAIDWLALEDMVRPFYTADLKKARGGRRGHGLPMMLRSFVLSLFWHGSFRAHSGGLGDSAAFSAFIGSPVARRPPCWTRLRDFARLLADSQSAGDPLPLADMIAMHVRSDLLAAGLEVLPGILREPIFRARTQSATSAAQAEALALENAETAARDLARREGAAGDDA